MSQADRLLNIQTNIQDQDEAEMERKSSMAKILLLFYLIIVKSYNKHLLGKQLQRFIEDNRLVQHAIGFLTLFVLISFESDVSGTSPNLSIPEALMYAIVGYMWFLFSSKLDLHWNLIFIVLLIGAYFVDHNMRIHEDEVRRDPSLTKKQVYDIVTRNNAWRATIAAMIVVVTIIGTVLYSDRKSEQYGGGYDVFTYLLY